MYLTIQITSLFWTKKTWHTHKLSHLFCCYYQIIVSNNLCYTLVCFIFSRKSHLNTYIQIYYRYWNWLLTGYFLVKPSKNAFYQSVLSSSSVYLVGVCFYQVRMCNMDSNVCDSNLVIAFGGYWLAPVSFWWWVFCVWRLYAYTHWFNNVMDGFEIKSKGIMRNAKFWYTWLSVCGVSLYENNWSIEWFICFKI